MQIRIEIDEHLTETEVVIKTAQLNDDVTRLQQLLSQAATPSLVFYKGDGEYFIAINEVLFFETDGAKIYAHTREDAYEVKMKLYELEAYLPRYFCRVAKSTIVNTKQIYALNKSFSGSSSISFSQTHKQVHVSRHYYQFLKERIRETR